MVLYDPKAFARWATMIIDDATKDAIKRYRRPRGECPYCDEHGDSMMMPSHTPSSRCESGKHPHCTCDACF